MQHKARLSVQALNNRTYDTVNAKTVLCWILCDESKHRPPVLEEDKVGMSTGSDAALRCLCRWHLDYQNSQQIILAQRIKINAGSDTGTGKAGVDLSIVSRYGTIHAADAFKICDNTGANWSKVHLA